MDYRLREIVTEPGGEGMRHAQISIVLREMMHEMQIKRGTVNYAMVVRQRKIRHLPDSDVVVSVRRGHHLCSFFDRSYS